MSRYLLDVNTLLALLDPKHLFHDAAHRWLKTRPRSIKLLTSPIVQNGVMRVASQARYPNPIGTVADVRLALRSFCALASHEFCPDDVSLVDDSVIANPILLSAAHITDVYLLALARKHKAKLATFDVRIPSDAIVDGSEAIEIIVA